MCKSQVNDAKQSISMSRDLLTSFEKEFITQTIHQPAPLIIGNCDQFFII